MSNLNACFSLFVYLCIYCVRARVFFQVFLLSFYLLPVFFGISRSLLRARTLRRLRRNSIKVLRCTSLVWANRIVAILPRASYLYVLKLLPGEPFFAAGTFRLHRKRFSLSSNRFFPPREQERLRLFQSFVRNFICLRCLRIRCHEILSILRRRTVILGENRVVIVPSVEV